MSSLIDSRCKYCLIRTETSLAVLQCVIPFNFLFSINPLFFNEGVN
jgi:hypothetical protein